MAIVEMVMPKMGESIMEGTVLTWLKKEGDTIEPDESVLEVATDKVDTEVPATHGGILKEILVKEGDVVAVGAPIAKIETDAAVETESQPTTAPAATASAPQPQAEAQPAAVSASSNGQSSNGQTSSDRFYSPLVMSIARQENISMAELESVPGTGREGRVTKKDILAYVKNRPAAGQATSSPAPAAQPAAAPARTPQPMPVSISGEDEIIEIDRWDMS